MKNYKQNAISAIGLFVFIVLVAAAVILYMSNIFSQYIFYASLVVSAFISYSIKGKKQ